MANPPIYTPQASGIGASSLQDANTMAAPVGLGLTTPSQTYAPTASGLSAQGDAELKKRILEQTGGTRYTSNVYEPNAAAYQSQALDAAQQQNQNFAGRAYGQNAIYGRVSDTRKNLVTDRTNLGNAGQAAGNYGPNNLAIDGSMVSPQQQLLDAMAQRASGFLYTPEQNQLRQGQQDALAQQMAVASTMQNGANAGLLRRQYAQSAADAGQTNDAARQMLQAQQISQGQQQLSAALNTARGQDFNLAQGNAQLQGQNAQMQNEMAQYNAGQRNQFATSQAEMDRQRMLLDAQMQNAGADRNMQAQLANQGYQLHAYGQNQARLIAGLGNDININNTNLQSSMLLDAARQNAQQRAQALQAGVTVQDAQNTAALVGAAIGAGGTGIAQGIKTL